ncbi:MAG: helix-turn-helix domain-containing protein [Faecalicoccus sp.]|uniref:helix-turn-helix transcriptional regulator n=1 Tax=Faecalicoccus sp. TaxID=1971758 RepID=UPI002A7F0D99|nr:helix-turn-helix domain-containing protein [Faecalicoccus sp.]MDY4869083.1 helix-turn-helix domain-containing protein [Faecalicoccus sp.]
MSINSRIKERREELEMSRQELADKIGVTPSAIANYENGVSSPKIELLYKLFDVLECDANYLYQDEMKNFTDDNEVKLSKDEMKIIEHYRLLSDKGKNAVQYIFEQEEKIRKYESKLEALVDDE